MTGLTGMDLTPTAPLALSLGRTSDAARALSLRNLISQAGKERATAAFAAEDNTPMHRLRQAFAHLVGLLQPYVQGTVAELNAVRANARLPAAVREAANDAMADLRVLPAQRPELVVELGQKVDDAFAAVGAHYEQGVAEGRAAEAGAEGAEALVELRDALCAVREDVPEVEALIVKVDTAISNLEGPKSRSATAGMVAG